MNIKKVASLKEKSEKNIDKTIKEYNDWIKNMQIMPDWLYWVIGILSISIIVFFKTALNSWVTILLSILSIKSLITIAQREGHKEGYLYGYDTGFNEGVNKTLGIDESDENFIEEVEIDNEINKDS